MKPLPARISKKIFRKLEKTSILLRKRTEITDPDYGTRPAFADYTITALVLPAPSRILSFTREGMWEDGTLRLFTEPEYVIDGTTITVATGDRVRIGDLWGDIPQVVD